MHFVPQVLQLFTSVAVFTQAFEQTVPELLQVPVVHDWQPPLALQAALQQCLSPEQNPVPHSDPAAHVAPPFFFGMQDPPEQ